MKRFWIPDRKGTELRPQTSQKPTKLIIRGVPAGSPLYHDVAQAFAGRLKTFHAKQQQAYALSTNQVYKSRFSWGGARATYSNIHGQEILELEVDISVFEELEKKKQKERWSWARVDFNFPVTSNLDGAFIFARLRDPDVVSMQTSGSFVPALQPHDFNKFGFAGGDGIVLAHQMDTTATDIKFSLLFDLRTDFDHPSALIADVHAGAVQRIPEVIGYRTVQVGTVSESRWYPLDNAFATIDDWQGWWDAAGYAREFKTVSGIPFTLPYEDQGLKIPNVYGVPPGPFNIVDGSPPAGQDGWQFVARTLDAYGCIISYSFATLRWNPTFTAFVASGLFTYTYETEVLTANNDIPATGPGTINGISFKEDFPWAPRRWDTPTASSYFPSYRWLPTGVLGPEWLDIPHIATVTWPNALYAGDLEASNIFLGTIIADRDNGAISFQAAP